MAQPSRHRLCQPTFAQAAVDYRNYLQLLGYAHDTCQQKYLAVCEFFSFLELRGVGRLEEINALDVHQFYEYAKHRNSFKTNALLSEKSVYSILRAVQTYFGYAMRLGLLMTDPSSHLRLPYPVQEVERRIFSQQEVQELYQAVDNEQENAILHLAYGCGLRVREISLLAVEDVRLTEGWVVVQKGKNSTRRVVPMSERICVDLEDFINAIEDSRKCLFVNTKKDPMQPWTLNALLKKWIRRTAFGSRLNELEIKQLGIHTLRHSIATHLLQNGMKIGLVQQFLGHRWLESTATYTQVNPQQISGLLEEINDEVMEEVLEVNF